MLIFIVVIVIIVIRIMQLGTGRGYWNFFL
jgi:hypothetical protein